MTKSPKPCPLCKEYHEDIFGIKELVEVVKVTQDNKNFGIRVGDKAFTLSWSTYGSPMYYRVEFIDKHGELAYNRENFEPCQLKKVE